MRKLGKLKGKEIRSKYNFEKNILLLHNKNYLKESSMLKFHGVVSFIFSRKSFMLTMPSKKKCWIDNDKIFCRDE